MKIIYDNKKSEKEIIANTGFINLDHDFSTLQNILIKGNNLEILNSLCYKYNLLGKIDLIYIDPPFATNKKFTIGNDRVSTISNSIFDKVAYEDNLLGDDFIEFIRERLVFLKNLLSDTGSIYLHIDYKIGHYIKIIMDEIFGISNFKNDISRIKCNPKNFNRKAYGNTKDMILFYSKSKNLKRNNPIIEFKEEDKKRIFKKIDKNGKYYTTIPLHAPGSTINGDTGKERKGVMPPEGRHRRTSPKILDERDNEGLIERSSNGNPRKKIFSDDRIGKKMQDIREFKDYQNPKYPTQKNIDLLRYIINASSNPGDIVLDCFCGSGTTLIASHELDRKRIGIDQSMEAISVCKNRFEESGIKKSDYLLYEVS